MNIILLMTMLITSFAIKADERFFAPMPLSQWHESIGAIDFNGDHAADDVSIISISQSNQPSEAVKLIDLMAHYQKAKNNIPFYRFKTGLPTSATIALAVSLSGKSEAQKMVFYNAEYFPSPKLYKRLGLHLIKGEQLVDNSNKRLLPVKQQAKGDVLEMIGCVGSCSDSSPNASYLFWNGQHFILFMDDEIGGD